MTEQSAGEEERRLQACAMLSEQPRKKIGERELEGRELRHAGRGALPGARTEQRNRVGVGAGLLGNPRVEKPDAGRRQRGRRDPIEGQDDSVPTRRRPRSRDAEEDPLDEDGGSGVGNGQRDAPLHWTAPQYEVAEGEAVGMNLEVHDAQALLNRMSRENPHGARFSMNIIPVPVKDSAASTKIIKGRFGSFFPTERQPPANHQCVHPLAVDPADASNTGEIVKGRFLGSLITTDDPWSLMPPDDDEVEDQDGNTATPDVAMNEQILAESAENNNSEGIRGRRGKKRAKRPCDAPRTPRASGL